MNKKFILVLLVIIIILGIVFGYNFLVANKKEKNESISDKTNISSQDTELTSEAENEELIENNIVNDEIESKEDEKEEKSNTENKTVEKEDKKDKENTIKESESKEEKENTVQENEIKSDTTKEEKQETKNELFSKYYGKAEKLLETMTLEEKVGQMFLARYPESGVINEIKNQNPGGYILFGRDFQNKTKQQIINELKNDQKNSKIKLALGVDEEGGTVVRVSAYKAFRSSKFKSPQELYKSGGLNAILKDSKEKSK